jgi:ABC-2 type transport system ATP-binding protein
MIEVRDLQKRYGALRAVDGVSFTIARGETFGLLGPNGAGKTTAILMMAGALRPDGGGVAVDGKPDPMRAEVRRALGIAPQSLAIYEELTADENLTFFGRLQGLGGKRLRERVDWCLEFAQLQDRRAGRVATFSGGMKRRLNLACALVHEPKVLFCDEPTVGVDPQSRNHVFESIERLRRDGTTIVYTTHYMEEAQRLCDRVAIVDHGRVLAEGTVGELIERHGGAALVEAELRAPPDAVAATALPGAVDGTRLAVQTERPFETVAAIARAGVDVAALRVERPGLEHVFLSLTGRRLRDE